MARKKNEKKTQRSHTFVVEKFDVKLIGVGGIMLNHEAEKK